jgi:hydrogenase maturation protein HypF
MKARVRKAIEVTGIVQGVGFRPYVYRLACERRLTGFITNTSAGVSIEIEGPAEDVGDFVSRLPAEAPPLARITHLAAHDIPVNADGDFRILPSRAGENRRVLISPDVAICDDCLRELFDPADRRFHYPFINCTNCGPRYTIVRDIPYDRARTSMAVFPMCPDCRREYDNPLDRRFHAQPNACWKCGPQVELWDAAGTCLVSARGQDSGFGIQDSGSTPTGPIAVGAGLVPARPLLNEEGSKGWCSVQEGQADPIAEAAARLQAGFVVAVKGLGGFHLAVDATNPAAVSRLREGKRRVEKPFAIMVANLEVARKICELDDSARALLSSPERPIVLLRKKFVGAHQGVPPHDIPLHEISSLIADQVAPFNLEYGVFLPYTPLHYLLFAAGGFQALVMTSGNISEEPIAIDNAEAVARLRGIADFFLVHNRDILLRCDDSVVRARQVAQTSAYEVCGSSLPASADVGAVHETPLLRERQSLSAIQSPEPEVPSNRSDRKLGKPGRGHAVYLLRRSRGYVPVPVFLNEDLLPVLAVGGELKNTICFTKGRHAFLSQHIGDLENLESYAFFEATITRFKRILEVEPRLLAYDLHPDYFSTRWALGQTGIERVGVQHHHAHIVSCMAENHLEGKVIGIALDGTGYGTDGAVWGGEVLLASFADFERMAHLDYVPMPGGAAAISEPWRMAVSYLHKHFGEALWDLEIPFVRDFVVGAHRDAPLHDAQGPELSVGAHRDAPLRQQVAVLVRMAERGINSPLTSSCGRLFDAVSALARIRRRVNYEAQAAIELEAAIAGDGEDSSYPFELRADGNGWIIDTQPLFAALVDDLKCSSPVGIVSCRFHKGFVDVLARVASLIQAKSGVNNVCLSGGSFQNVFLLEHLTRRLEADGLNVFTHSEVPPGDGGLSLGQALVAAHRSS